MKLHSTVSNVFLKIYEQKDFLKFISVREFYYIAQKSYFGRCIATNKSGLIRVNEFR